MCRIKSKDEQGKVTVSARKTKGVKGQKRRTPVWRLQGLAADPGQGGLLLCRHRSCVWYSPVLPACRAHLVKDLCQHRQDRLQVCAWWDELQRHKVLRNKRNKQRALSMCTPPMRGVGTTPKNLAVQRIPDRALENPEPYLHNRLIVPVN